ncbi:MAG: DNA (cytosine-5-)-methyltransferase [Bradyrhizobium sp. PARBB1]|jgi:DNA (cytosine-5)-methyltransferase 1|uniref:DNA cytosine methyltransferase n=1 Tax=Bradyrhizobium sp. TaxID=376 RepID=UPI000BC44FAB|nr:DNA cytosine methyltransferase [uncultured Bradyrhizobium sp.]OYU63917.1 MAG: DNA (cytosine-5-)-methyltransferase [Bradyrhizobium sp. PARBB1]QRI69906.1 DNA cytosine methyltransferase [Bradyrhizobium sp. PSBB068]
MSRVACIDLFCGAGGLTHGLIQAGIPVVAGIDVDAACRYPFETNNSARFIAKDIKNVKPADLKKLYGDAEIRILAGCAPCQPFSTYSQRYDTLTSPRWPLLYQFARLIKSVRPDVVTMENVPLVERHAVFDDFVATLRRLGYSVWQGVVDCTQYGLPQTRRRMVILASAIGPIELIAPTHEKPRTVKDAIGKLPVIEAGSAHKSDAFHMSSRLSDLNLERIRASRPGGTWRDWPKRLVADCHRKETGRTYPGVYGRMTWSDPAPTITTQFYGFGNGRFGHPEQDRGISLREGAILQGFPKDYAFVPEGGPTHFKVLGRMIGNAVPVVLGEAIGQSISAHLGIEADREGQKQGGIADVARKPLVA